MGFTLFDLDLLKGIDKTIKFKSFNTKSLATFTEVNETYLKIPNCYLNTSGKNIEQFRKLLHKDIKKSNAKAFRSHLQEFRADCQHYKLQDQYIKKQELLNSTIWEQWEKERFIHRMKLIKLKKLWEKNSSTSHFPSESLYVSAIGVLPIFEYFQQLATEEIKLYKKKLLPLTQMQLKKYLHILSEEIKQERFKLCDAMLSRLEIAGLYRDCSFADVTNYILQELKKLDLPIDVIPHVRHDLSENLFRYFHQYIHTNGSLAQQSKFKKLSWLKKDNSFSVQQIDDEIVIVPNEMKQFHIPQRSKSHFKWFYHWHNFRAEFFKNHFYLLVNIRLLKEPHYLPAMNMAELLQGKSWQKLNKLEQELFQENQQVIKILSSWRNKLFFRTTQRFYTHWQIFTLNSWSQLLQQKINYASLLAEQLRTRLLLELEEEIIDSENTKEMLLAIIASIENTLTSLKLPAPQQWLSIKKIFNQSLDYSSKKTPDVIANASAASNLEFFNTDKILFRLTKEIEPANLYNQNNALNHGLIEDIERSFQLLIKNDAFNIKQSNFGHLLAELKKKIDLCQASVNPCDLDAFWFKFFVYYLNTCLSNENQNALAEVLFLINTLGPNNIKDRANILEQYRATQSSFLYQTRCRALLFSFKENRDLIKQNSYPPSENLKEYCCDY